MNQDELFAKLKQDIETLNAQEVAAKETLIAKLKAVTDPLDKVFEEETAEAQTWARLLLEPHRKSMDDKVAAIMARAQKQVDKAVKNYTIQQNAIETEFYQRQDVMAAKAKFDAALEPHQTKFALEDKFLSDETDAAIAALQSAYDKAAKELDDAAEV